MGAGMGIISWRARCTVSVTQMHQHVGHVFGRAIVLHRECHAGTAIHRSR
jgi:hypothetical protein